MNIRALTICQPFAHLICLPESDPLNKRVENRKWFTPYRGPLAIHAGKSRDWLEPHEDRPGYDMTGVRLDELKYSAIVAIADLIDCIRIDAVSSSGCPADRLWMRKHIHTEGPWCLVLANVRPLHIPVPRGALGLWVWTPPADWRMP